MKLNIPVLAQVLGALVFLVGLYLMTNSVGWTLVVGGPLLFGVGVLYEVQQANATNADRRGDQ